MNNKLGVVLGVVLVVLVGLGVAGLSLPAVPELTQGPKGDKGDVGPRGLQGVQGLTGPRGPAGEPGLGAVVGPDQFLPHWNFNGMKVTRIEIPWNQGTSTVCSIPAPSATSTLFRAPTIQMTSATATDIQVGWGRGLGFEDFATTTLLNRSATTTTYITLSNNDTAIDDFVHSVVASTTDNEAFKLGNSEGMIPLDRVIFSPNDRFNVAIAAKNLDTTAAGTVSSENFNLRGSCTAEFLEF